MDAKDLKSLSAGEIKTFLESFDDVLCDCDGVIWFSTDPIPGSAHAIQKLRSLGKKVRFVSNNTVFTYDMFYNRLEKYKFGSEKDSFVVPTMAIIDYLQKINFSRELFVFGNPSLRHELKKAGFKLAPNGPDRIEETNESLLAKLEDNPNVGAVIVDIDLNLNYINLMLALIYLKRKDVLLLMGASDKVLPFTTKVQVIGPHYFQKLLEDISGRKALKFAKPSQLLSKYIQEKFEIKNPRRTLLIGDMLAQDMQFASSNGFQKLLVFSGATKKEDLENWNQPDDLKPDYCLDTLGSLVDIISTAL